ncbi:centriolin isoform X3 [Antennarius striatus]|uniref:centriolin isoform X3 n=1 Tax=Antennarius striatus TaxID=241820 RepID=UPI0035AF65F2
MEEQRETRGSPDAQKNRGGIMYITEELLMKLTGCQSLALVRSLNLSSLTGDKRIKFIENLHGCRHLEILKLDHNMIDRMERLNTLTQLRELQLAHNNIQRIEGLELMSRLQHLNLSHNRIEHIPLWFGNKLQSLHTLHLQHNLITSLYEVSRLRSLSSLSELTVSGNPACSLQHSRLFLLYHLRTLDRLDDLLVTQEERGHAHQRFNAVTSFHIIQKDEPMSDDREMEQQVMVTQRPQQEEANQALKTRRQARAPLEHLLHARSQLLKMTAAFHWLNELEKEWTFYKSDTKLPPLSSTGVQEADAVSDSLYIGKALHAITPIPQSSSPSFLQSQRSTDIHPDMQTPQPQLEYGMTDKSKASDQQLDHQEPEEALKQHTSLDSFLYKLSVLEQLKDEADEMQRRMEQQTEERRTTERETDELETQLLTLEPTDPQHAHVTSQLSSCRQLLERMSGKKSELEDRLDDMLSRIAVETQEITELEQQLTDGQILANEALQRDLEGIISGLQDYLRGLREKAHRAEQKVLSLQAENQNLQLHLVDAQRHCRHLEESARTSRQQEELSVLWTETQAQRERQAELEAELQQLREGLKWQITEAQVEKSSLQQVVQNLQDQLTQTRSQFHQTTTQYEDTKAHLDRTMLDSKELQTGSEELHEDQRSVDQQTRTSSEQLQEDHNHSKDQIARLQAQLAHSQNHITKLEAQVILSQDRIVQLETQAIQDQDRKAQMETQAAQDHNRVAQLESQLSQDGDGELERLRLRLQTSQSRNTHIQQKLEERLEQSRMQLHDVQQERDALLQQLCSQGSGHQKSLGRLNRKLRQLSRSMCNSDQLTTEQLKSTMEQLRSVKNMVELLHTQTQQAPSLASQGTQDSGLGLPYLGSPERQQDRPPAPPSAGGRWVYVPDTAEWRDCGGDGGSPAASAGPAWLFCGPPAVYSTPAGGAALHCNVPEHRHEVDRCVHEETDRLEKAKKKKLQMEIKQLRRTLRRHRGVMQVCDEVECVEKTLLKRQAELRQADRLLLEAQSCIDTTRDKASSAQREADVLQRTAEDGATCLLEAFRELQEEVEELLRSRQEEEEGLKEVEEALSHRHEELQRANSDRESAADRLATVLSDCQDSQRRLNSLVIQEEQQEQRIVQRTEELQTVVSRVEEVREEERRLHDRVMEMLDQQKTLLSEKRSTVTALRGDEQKLISVQSELHTHRAELKQLLQEVLVEQQTLEEVKTKHAHSLQQLQIKQDQLDRTLEELDLTKDELDGTKGELNGMTDKLEKITVELNRTKGELDVTKDELQGNKCELDKMKDKLVKTKAEVDRVKSELDGKRDVLEKTVDELESSKDELGRVKKQLEGTKSEFDGMKGELDKMLEDMGRKKEELAELQRDVSHRKKAKQRQTELQQEEEEELGRKRKEWSSLQEKCKHLEARRRHADRCLSVVEVELDKQREELKHLQLLKQEVQGDTAATQDQLNENSELLFLLSERVEERKKQLQTLEQELRVSRQQQRGKHLNEVVCGGMEIINAAGHLLEDRGCCLTQQELQLSQFTNAEEQLWEKEKDMLLKEEELNHKRKELQLKEEELKQQEKMLYLKWEEFNKTEEELDKKEEKLLTTEEENIRDESIYLSTAGLRSAFSPEETWEVEMQREQLRQKDDRLKARLRCNLWNQQETLEVRRVETEDSLLGLKHRLDQLDSLLGHTDESSGGHYFRDPESHV